LPWRATRLGVVVSVPDGTVVAPGLAAAVLVRLPATTAELAAALAEAAPADLAAAVDDLVARGVVVGAGR
jgi:hypothetical protein